MGIMGGWVLYLPDVDLSEGGVAAQCVDRVFGCVGGLGRIFT